MVLSASCVSYDNVELHNNSLDKVRKSIAMGMPSPLGTFEPAPPSLRVKFATLPVSTSHYKKGFALSCLYIYPTPLCGLYALEGEAVKKLRRIL
jgi:hypothetical protein